MIAILVIVFVAVVCIFYCRKKFKCESHGKYNIFVKSKAYYFAKPTAVEYTAVEQHLAIELTDIHMHRASCSPDKVSCLNYAMINM